MTVIAYLVELGPSGQRGRAAAAVAAKVARSFGPRPANRIESPSSLRDLATRRLGLVRFTRPR